MKQTRLFLLFLCLAGSLRAQDDLLALLEESEPPQTEYAYATFKTVRLVNGHSIEIPAPGVLQFMIAHRFGAVNTGLSDMFGLDQANMRLGFEYGISPHLSLGVGRSTVLKTYDANLKLKLLRQSSGKRQMPLTVEAVSVVAVNGMPWEDPNRVNYFSARLNYTHQLLLARKFSDRLSLQLMPSLVHRNLVPTREAQNDVYAMGVGGRYKITGSLTVNAEYYYILPGFVASNFENCLSLCFDIETGGHVFQLIFSNSPAMSDNLFIAQTTGAWMQGDIHFGFNLMRVFTVSNKQRLGE